ncbi:short-chain dehydrogenase [Zobellella denitrificans]|uniref:Short-chain dehydrogenase n=1 Tax=Zobellella denitrificans TaxID=347534 RepID=A0A231MYA1_9GAMM|nr:SDR family oxidoreductase [Zobellella denitrificans]ATG74901.1 short-chain dehydrogenase [Zobellella denitrificans]OXS15010.1 short-chain dehydrogenase [Zobellella denitrificans]
MDKLLQGKKLLITGAARGLGLDFARAATAAGAEVAMADILAGQVMAEARTLAAEGLIAHGLALDLADPASIEACARDAAGLLGGLDGLVNCGAIATGIGGVDMTDLDIEVWDRVMTVNVRGSWLMTRAAVPYLKAAGAGKVVNIASDTALWGAPRLLAYVASKGALLAMTRSMARELGEYRICVNAVSPGLTLVEATQYVPQARHDQYVDGRAIHRPQLPEDVNGAVLYLLSDLSSFVTGQNLPVNGGFVFN